MILSFIHPFLTCLVPCLSGFIPVCALGLSQVGRINLGQNVSSLRYFAICGLQEGFEPFAINMKRDITMWFSKSLPQFIPVPATHNHIEVLSFIYNKMFFLLSGTLSCNLFNFYYFFFF